MDIITKLISWKDKDNNIVKEFTISCDVTGIELLVKKSITDALYNKKSIGTLTTVNNYSSKTETHIYEEDWSNFGKDGDYITVKDM